MYRNFSVDATSLKLLPLSLFELHSLPISEWICTRQEPELTRFAGGCYQETRQKQILERPYTGCMRKTVLSASRRPMPIRPGRKVALLAHSKLKAKAKAKAKYIKASSRARAHLHPLPMCFGREHVPRLITSCVAQKISRTHRAVHIYKATSGRLSQSIPTPHTPTSFYEHEYALVEASRFLAPF